MAPQWETEWHDVDLSGVHGFPVWVREVHDVLVTPAWPRAHRLAPGTHACPAAPALLAQAASHTELAQVFAHYCKSIDPSKAVRGLRMGLKELMALVNDCGLLSKVYKEERVHQVGGWLPHSAALCPAGPPRGAPRCTPI